MRGKLTRESRLPTVCVQQKKIVGYPVCIEDDKYHRNALLFNIGTPWKTTSAGNTVRRADGFAACSTRPGFVFDEHVDTSPYRPILRKLGALMESMEKESGFLLNGESKALLAHILPQILADLLLNGECTIPVNTANIINLKLFPKLHDPSPVFDYQVPVAIRDLRLLLENSGTSVSLLCVASGYALHLLTSTRGQPSGISRCSRSCRSSTASSTSSASASKPTWRSRS